MAGTKLPRLIAISDRHGLPDQDLESWFEAVAAAGVDGVQLREKDLDDRALYQLTRLARRRLPQEVCLLVNGRADIALAGGADGVHLPADAVPAVRLRQRFGGGLVIGCSVHSLNEAQTAEAGGADFVAFGPVYATPSKVRFGPPLGLAELRRLSGQVQLPVFALGGVGQESLAEVAGAGAAGAAGIRIFQQPECLPSLVAAARLHFPREAR